MHNWRYLIIVLASWSATMGLVLAYTNVSTAILEPAFRLYQREYNVQSPIVHSQISLFRVDDALTIPSADLSVLASATTFVITATSTPTALPVNRSIPLSANPTDDIVQLGPLVLSKSLLSMIFPLIGVVIGGTIGYFSTTANANRTWKRQKEEKLQEERRGAVVAVMAWVKPIQDALESIMWWYDEYEKQRINEDIFHARYQELMSPLALLTLPAHQQLLLPKDIYSGLSKIVRELRGVLMLRIISEESPEELYQAINIMYVELKRIGDELHEGYKKTFS